MRNLLAANFLRLGKSALFWGALAFCLGAGALMALQLYQMNQYEDFPLDGAFFTYPIFVCIIIAVFIPLFFGRDYSDHTIRNKVAAGHPRAAIYAANLLTDTAVSLLLCAAYMAVVAAIGIPGGAGFHGPGTGRTDGIGLAGGNGGVQRTVYPCLNGLHQ